MGDILADWYFWTKSLHIVSVIAWMAGIFYLPRLFVYHAEVVGSGNETDDLFQIMERRLLKAIMNPAMISTWIFGLCCLRPLVWWIGATFGPGSRVPLCLG